MSLPVSSSLRICTSCDAAIDRGAQFGHDPDGCVICVDCIPSDFDYGQYEDVVLGTWGQWSADYDDWREDDGDY